MKAIIMSMSESARMRIVIVLATIYYSGLIWATTEMIRGQM